MPAIAPRDRGAKLPFPPRNFCCDRTRRLQGWSRSVVAQAVQRAASALFRELHEAHGDVPQVLAFEEVDPILGVPLVVDALYDVNGLSNQSCPHLAFAR